jgi:hypothetical protein
MVGRFKFGRKLPLPSVIQIKHQILMAWLADQTAIEAAEEVARIPPPALHSKCQNSDEKLV